MPHDHASRLSAFIDREDLFDLVRRERFARDQRRFDVMADCFHRDAYVRTSWYEGHGGVAYVEATRSFMNKAGNGKHWVFPAFAELAGDRATVESPAMIFSRVILDRAEADLHVFCRFFSRAVRVGDGWKLMSFHVFFERDVLKPVNPIETLPIDWSLIATLRPSYKFLAYVQRTRGVTVDPALLGDDRPHELAAFHAAESSWLVGNA